MKTDLIRKSSGLCASVLSAAMCFSMIPAITGNSVVLADSSKNQDNTRLGTAQIADPDVPADANAAWAGSYVYYGNYGDDAIKFRVLDTSTTKYGYSTMFLDCDRVLFNRRFDDASNKWADSELKGYLNDDFLKTYFSKAEQSAIAKSMIAGGQSYESGSWAEFAYGKTVGLNGEKIFVLDDEDLMNEDYGYTSDPGMTLRSGTWSGQDFERHIVPNRAKQPASERGGYWLRTALKRAGNCASGVDYTGVLTQFVVSADSNVGISPALNVSRSSIIFASLVSGTYGKIGSEYKLTIADSEISIALQSGSSASISGRTVTIPYQITGANAGNATRVSCLILDKEYSAGNSDNANILYYDGLSGSAASSGMGSFTIPSDLKPENWGIKYFVYILAEDINGAKETDYASVPVRVDISNGGGQWFMGSNGWSYRTADGTFVKSCWMQIDAAWYHFNASGYAETGWVNDGNTWYYCSSKGAMQTGWQQIGGSWYYLGGSGAMRTGWQEIGGKWYYLGGNGAMRTGWQVISGKWYYFGDSGEMRTGWQEIGGVWFFFKSGGDMAANEYCGGYWLNSNGSWTYKHKASWHENYKGWWFGDDTGWYAAGGTYKIDGRDYVFDSSGYCTNPY